MTVATQAQAGRTVTVEVQPHAEIWRQGRGWRGGQQLRVKKTDAKYLAERGMVRVLGRPD